MRTHVRGWNEIVFSLLARSVGILSYFLQRGERSLTGCLYNACYRNTSLRSGVRA
jgi:hypothetical protein